MRPAMVAGPVAVAACILAGVVVAALGMARMAPGVARAAGWVHAASYQGRTPFVLHVAGGDLDGDGRDELVSAGRDYERGQDFLQVLALRANAAASARLDVVANHSFPMDPLGHLAIGVGPITGGSRPDVVMAAGSRLELWRWRGDGLERHWVGRLQETVADLAVVALARDASGVAVTVVRTRPQWHKVLRVLVWNGTQLVPQGSDVPVGMVRAMSAGDLLGDGRSELILEVGSGNAPGQVEVWRWSEANGGFRRAAGQTVRDAPIFAMDTGTPATAAVGEARPDRLLLADNRGRVALYAWDEDAGYRRVGASSGLGWSLVAAALGKFTVDGPLQAVVVEYPNLLHLLEWRS